MRRPQASRWLLRIHQWLGLLLSIYAILIGASGAVLIFHDELDALFYPEFHSGAVSEPFEGSPSTAVDAARRAFPGWRPISVTWPNRDCPFWMTYMLRGPDAMEVYSDPTTGAMVRSRGAQSGWIQHLERFHVNFFAGRNGRTVNGWAACGLGILSITGVSVWWRKRRARRVHYITGAVCAMFILIAAVSGTYLIWPQGYVRAVSRVLGRAKEPRIAPRPRGTPLLTLDEQAARARAIVPGAPIHRLQVVDRPDQAVRVTLREGSPGEFHRVSTVMLDPVTGEAAQVTLLRDRPAGDVALAWLSVMHFGIFAGITGKAAWAALSLGLPVLSVTGLALWLRRQ